MTGSGARSEVWCTILANALGRTLEASDEAVEGRGAAIFAAVALGLFSDYDHAAEAWVPIERRYVPDAAAVDAYRRAYDDWQSAAAATRPLDRRAANFSL